jgi:hypothetical protein
MTKQGPALVITFQVNMLHVVKNREGKVIEGDPVRQSGNLCKYTFLQYFLEQCYPRPPSLGSLP